MDDGAKREGIAEVRLSNGSAHLAEIHWYEAAGMDRKEFKIKEPALTNMTKSRSKQLVICVDNEGYEVSLEKRKIYVTLRYPAAENSTCCGSSMSPARTTSIRRHSSARLPLPSL